MTGHLIRITTALAVVAVAGVAAIISYQHAYELVTSHGEAGLTARLLPFTVDGLIWAASMVVLDASRRGQPVPAAGPGHCAGTTPGLPAPAARQQVPPPAASLEQAVPSRHSAGHSQRAIARELSVDRR